ncbi:MAG: glycosyltransferase family 39 protein [Anaerolineae bacterium]|nr:glycosyltransferase family 39 protein [Anaerolineae bacterium]
MRLRAGYAGEALLLLGFSLAALALRQVNLVWAPSYTDESREVLWAIQIYQGSHYPLTGCDPYLGPIFPYLLALLFHVFGLNLVIPRLTIAVFGALTVPVVYLLARQTGSRRVALAAAGLTLVSPMLTTWISHKAFSAGLTPFFVALTLASLSAAVARPRSGLLECSGVLAGLTLQTHPTSAAVLLGAVVWFLRQPSVGSRWRQAALWRAITLFGLAYSPLLVANLRPDSPLLAVYRVRESHNQLPNLAEYTQSVLLLLKDTLYLVGGGLPPTTPLVRLMIGLSGVALMVGLGLLWRRGHLLIPYVFIATLLTLPLLVRQSSYYYFAFLAPLGYIAIAYGVKQGLEWLRMWLAVVSSGRLKRLPLRLALNGAFAVLVGGVGVYSVGTIVRHYQYLAQQDLTNAAYFELLAVLRQNGACGDRLFLADLGEDWATVAEAEAHYGLWAIEHALILDQCGATSTTAAALEQRLAAQQDAWLIVPDPHSDRFSAGLRLESVARVTLPPIVAQRLPVGVYRVTLRPR